MTHKDNADHLSFEEMRLLKLLLETEQLSLAAERLGHSASTVSRQLAHAREVLGDPLFVRAKTGLLPTARMLAISSKMDRLLEIWDDMADEKPFSPASSERRFRIMTADNGLNAYLTECLPAILAQAPRARLIVEPLSDDVFESLRCGEADVAVYPTTDIPAECRAVPLPVMHPVALMRPGHPLVKRFRAQGRLRQADFDAYPLLMCDPRIGTRFREALEAECKRARLIIPYFNALRAILEKTDFVAWSPKASARQWVDAGALFAAPVEDSPFTSFQPQLIWHERTHADPACQWLRGMILQFAARCEA